jgi:phenylacetate-coenzyme A ligase PaaK-like adenylate-forming protein
MVVTTLAKEGTPLLRYRTRDITRIIPGRCSCGSLLPRHSRIKGRSDDTFKFRGVNIYPSSIDTVLSEVVSIGSEFQVHLSRDEASGRDHMRLAVERAEGVDDGQTPDLLRETVHLFKKQLLVTPEVEVLPYGALPRSERKSRRIFDSRLGDEIV